MVADRVRTGSKARLFTPLMRKEVKQVDYSQTEDSFLEKSEVERECTSLSATLSTTRAPHILIH